MRYFNREFKVLTDQQLERVHALTLEVLERKGILFHSEAARVLLARHGARVDGECVRLSPSQVEAALAQCPPRFLWQAHDSRKSLLVGDGQDGVLVIQDHGPVFVQERSGTRRLGTLDDVVNFYKLGQTSSMTRIVGQCTVDPHELDDSPAKHTRITHELLRHTDKPILSWPQMSDRATQDIFRMVEMVMGEGYLARNHFLTASVCALSPLQYAQESADTIIAYARAGQPVLLLTAPMNGVSAPIGDVASLVMQNAEILAGLVLRRSSRRASPSSTASGPMLPTCAPALSSPARRTPNWSTGRPCNWRRRSTACPPASWRAIPMPRSPTSRPATRPCRTMSCCSWAGRT